MKLAVIDTNLIVSAAIQPQGIPAKIIHNWVLKHRVMAVTCSAIVVEYREVMHRSKFTRYSFPPRWFEVLIEEGIQLPDPAPWPLTGPDPRDLKFLSLAKAAGACLVTGNLRHFPVEIRDGVAVFSPADYLAGLTADNEPLR
jgi:putative PIN family toxin of toxin-antitoxin system